MKKDTGIKMRMDTKFAGGNIERQIDKERQQNRLGYSMNMST